MTRPRTSIATVVVAAALATAGGQADLAARQKAGAVPVMAPRSPTAVAQGFSVVLVVGDLQAAGGEEDVPPAARRALTDMKDFLPYKSYKLVDAAWIIGSHTTSRLRGPEDREYELVINASDGPTGKLGLGQASTAESRIAVAFSLREVGSRDGSRGGEPSDEGQSLVELRKQLESLQARLTAARARSSAQNPEVVNLEQESRVVTAKIEQAQRSGERRGFVPSTIGRAVMNTSFSMDVGETVVVGTSRLSGNSKALIALLTAVPAKSSRR